MWEGLAETEGELDSENEPENEAVPEMEREVKPDGLLLRVPPPAQTSIALQYTRTEPLPPGKPAAPPAAPAKKEVVAAPPA